MDIINILLLLLSCSFVVPLSRAIAKKTKDEWKDNHCLDYLKVFLMIIVMSVTLCMSIYISPRLWYGFLIGVSLGYFWRNKHSPFIGALLGTSLLFNNVLFVMLAVIVMMIITYGPELKHIDFLLFLSTAILFYYIGAISVDIRVFNLAATGGGIAGLMINEAGFIWRTKKKSQKKKQ
jgi:hypothetical protein